MSSFCGDRLCNDMAKSSAFLAVCNAMAKKTTFATAVSDSDQQSQKLGFFFGRVQCHGQKNHFCYCSF